MSGSPRYIQYRGDPPPCDRTHRTPPGLPFGQTTLLSTHALGGGPPVRPSAGESQNGGTDRAAARGGPATRSPPNPVSGAHT
ncbi:hypothetical protein DTW94_32520 [Streptomyces cavourensis]|uniref:Uncharacterized protein n=1 Tax=Streptomyces cavourensis TaxID=67258 RepID=A0AAD0VHY9_9ACTN|nr:hypothetical protein DTW94_32520 [Streptomyces cavourensis]